MFRKNNIYTCPPKYGCTTLKHQLSLAPSRNSYCASQTLLVHSGRYCSYTDVDQMFSHFRILSIFHSRFRRQQRRSGGYSQRFTFVASRGSRAHWCAVQRTWRSGHGDAVAVHWGKIRCVLGGDQAPSRVTDARTSRRTFSHNRCWGRGACLSVCSVQMIWFTVNSRLGS
jgi:hypothetical protein